MNVNKNNYQLKIKKSNSKTVIIISTLKSVRAFISACVLKQAAVAN